MARRAALHTQHSLRTLAHRRCSVTRVFPVWFRCSRRVASHLCASRQRSRLSRPRGAGTNHGAARGHGAPSARRHRGPIAVPGVPNNLDSNDFRNSGARPNRLLRTAGATRNPHAKQTAHQLGSSSPAPTCTADRGKAERTSQGVGAYALAGYLVERGSRQRFEDYAANNILRPLGMERSAFHRGGGNAVAATWLTSGVSGVALSAFRRRSATPNSGTWAWMQLCASRHAVRAGVSVRPPCAVLSTVAARTAS